MQPPVFVSVVGGDELGVSFRRAMIAHSMIDSGLQKNGKPTGVVKVIFAEGQPQYQIIEDQAYDDLELEPQLVAQRNVSVIYHGSLAGRSSTTRATILQYRSDVNAPIRLARTMRLLPQ